MAMNTFNKKGEQAHKEQPQSEKIHERIFRCVRFHPPPPTKKMIHQSKLSSLVKAFSLIHAILNGSLFCTLISYRHPYFLGILFTNQSASSVTASESVTSGFRISQNTETKMTGDFVGPYTFFQFSAYWGRRNAGLTLETI